MPYSRRDYRNNEGRRDKIRAVISDVLNEIVPKLGAHIKYKIIRAISYRLIYPVLLLKHKDPKDHRQMELFDD